VDRLDGRRPYRQRLGTRGEDRAADWYRAAGYDVIARNWRCPEGELDLVVSLPGELVFCEVKTRSSDRFGVPAEAVTAAKQRRLRALAARFLAEHPQVSGPAVGSIRFDVVAVIGSSIDVIEAAF
jgi:putative endonuclease